MSLRWRSVREGSLYCRRHACAPSVGRSTTLSDGSVDPPTPPKINEQTVTETAAEFQDLEGTKRRTPGMLIIYCQRPCRPVGVRLWRPLTFGREEGVGATLDDPNVSRRHVLIEAADGGVRVSDLGSRNGTHIDAERVSSERTFAPFGSVVRLGKTILLATDHVERFEGSADERFPLLVGGPSLADVRMRIATVAQAAAPVLIEGETGTGKEVVARVIHDRSGREGQFVGINCAALAPELVESELFGHAKGAFSGAAGSRVGLFRAAERGTLLLDELGELPLTMQAKLLRVIETGEVRSVGEDQPTRVDVRLLAATNRNLGDMVDAGDFRGDLLHRIAAVRIRLPRLKDRREDIPLLAAHFLAEESMELTVGAAERLVRHSWPGNVRELRNAVAAAASVAKAADRDKVRADDIDDDLRPRSDDPEDSLRARIVQALTATEGNVSRAAREIGMARSGMYEALKRLGIRPAAYRRRTVPPGSR